MNVIFSISNIRFTKLFASSGRYEDDFLNEELIEEVPEEDNGEMSPLNLEDQEYIEEVPEELNEEVPEDDMPVFNLLDVFDEEFIEEVPEEDNGEMSPLNLEVQELNEEVPEEDDMPVFNLLDAFDEVAEDDYVPTTVWEHVLGRRVFDNFRHLPREGEIVESIDLNLDDALVMDTYMLEEIPVFEYLQNQDPYDHPELLRGPLVVLLDDNNNIQRIDSIYNTQLVRLLQNVESHMFECTGPRIEIPYNNDLEKFDRKIVEGTSIYGNINNGYLLFNFEYSGLISIPQITTLLNRHIVDGIIQPFIFAIKPVGEFTHTMNYQNSFGTIYNNMLPNYVSSKHCQHGSNQTVYDIFEVTF